MEWGKIDNLLTTKFQFPYLPDDFVFREVLVERFVANAAKPLILVSSGSGSGKSLFVRSCMERMPHVTAWVSLDPSDDDLRIFFSYFVMALHRQLPSFGERTLSLLAATHLPSSDELGHTLINELNTLTRDITLVIDDLHLIRDREIHRILGEMLAFPPPRFHLVIISRQDPPLPLERLKAHDRMFRIGPDDLRMNTLEIRTFLQKHLRRDDLDELVSLLEKKTEGWITGLRLALLHASMKSSDLNETIRFLDESDLTGRYFMEEVMKGLDPSLKTFLLRTSVPERFSSSLADHLMGHSFEGGSSAEVLEKVLHGNLFLTPLDEHGHWFRYHQLFREALQRELERESPPEEIRALHERCIEWFEANDFIEEAFHHAGIIGDHGRMATMIEVHLDRPLNEDKWYLLDEWLGRLPESYLSSRPGLLVARMWVMHNKATWLIPDLLREFDRQWKEQEVDAAIAVQVRFFRGVVQYWGTRFRESLESFEYVKKNLPAEKRGATSINNYYYLMASHINGKGDKAVREIRKLLLNESLDPFYRATILGGIAYVRMLEGDLDGVMELIRRVYAIGEGLKSPFLKVWSSYLEGMAAFYRNDLERAEGAFARTLDHIYMLNLLGPVDCFAGYGLTLQTLGKKRKLQEVVERMQAFVRQRDNPAMDTFLASFLGRLALLEGDKERAARHLKRVNMYFESGNLFFWIETPRVTRCKYLLVRGDDEALEEAERLVAGTMQLARETRNVPQQVQMLVLSALLRDRRGARREALALVGEALTIAASGEWVRPFFEAGETMRRLLEEVSPPAGTTSFRLTLLRHFSRYPQTGRLPDLTEQQEEGNDSPDVWNILTNRELDVLHLLAQRKSNKEIASQLFISVATVKRHTITIYRKLGVGKRQEAVARASKLGILK